MSIGGTALPLWLGSTARSKRPGGAATARLRTWLWAARDTQGERPGHWARVPVCFFLLAFLPFRALVLYETPCNKKLGDCNKCLTIRPERTLPPLACYPRQTSRSRASRPGTCRAQLMMS
eukprot:scaffold8327_cov58-Phaeocystis_antarctica.AAC.3